MKPVQRLGRTLGVAVVVSLVLGACGPPPEALTREAVAAQNVDHADVFAEHSVVYGWMRTTLDAITANPPHPTATTWRLHVLTSSMYEAWAAYQPAALGPVLGEGFRRPVAERTSQNAEVAVSYAAHRALSYLYPRQGELFDTVLHEVQGLPPFDGTDQDRPAGVGNLAALSVIDARLDDGANALEGFRDTVSATYPELYTPVNSADPVAAHAPGGPAFDPNRWQPLRVPTGRVRDRRGWPIIDPDDHLSYAEQEFLTPHWGAVRPFAIPDGAALRPPPPPQYGSDAPYVDGSGVRSTSHEAWERQIAELIEVSAALTPRQKAIAELWADGPRTWTPPGHWVQIALGICIRDRHGLDEDVLLFYGLGGALLDAGIAAWDAKRHYDFIRPQSAIHHRYAGEQISAWAGPDRGTATIPGEAWRPYQELDFVTPAFPEYVSGHSAFSFAAAELITHQAGRADLYDGVTLLGEDFDGSGAVDLLGQHITPVDGIVFESGPDEQVVLRWDTLEDAAAESARSRIYGGIHIQDGDLRARPMGRASGQAAAERVALLRDPFAVLPTLVSARTARAIAPVAEQWIDGDTDQRCAAARELQQLIGTDAPDAAAEPDEAAALAELLHQVSCDGT